MSVDVRILTAALVILAAKTIFAQVPGDICGYMIQIPRPPKPDIPDENFDDLTWNQRPLVPAEEREDVCMDIFYVDPHTSMQIIYMEEEIQGDVAIAKLNYKGSGTPEVVSPFVHGSFSMLGPVIRRIPEVDGDWHLVVTNRQDFESPGMQSYSFRIRVPDEALVVEVSLVIVNIDDNPPIIELIGPCTITEHDEIGVSACKYRVSDIDGEISTRFMTFSIDSDRGDEQIFEFIRENVPNQWMWLYMVMVVKQPLDFVESPLHIFRVTAYDSLPNTHTVSMMVEVENVESRPPVWVEIFAMQEFDEKTEQSFRVRAIDRDTGVNSSIHYRLETADAEDKKLFKIETIEGGYEGAWLHVAEIDRDTLEREVFYLTLIAYKYGANDVEGSPSFVTPTNVVIMVRDVNDQTPLPFHSEYTIDIYEETAQTLNLEEFGFHDRDLGPNAEYTVKLESVFPPGAHAAFYIAPERGYQRQSFIIGTVNHHMLDFEEELFRKIQLQAVATDMLNNSMVGIATININLINWNDELPMFEHTAQTVKFKETVGIGYPVGIVLAKDRDVGDRVEHSIMGNVDYLSIDKRTGEVFVTVDDAFNYHRQNELFIQIRADDTLGDPPYHTNTSQLVIQLEDVNNTPPTLRLPRRTPEVEENVPQGHLISKELTATDPDTTAYLIFEIDWDTSYATKQGRETPAKEFHHCVTIETVHSADSQGIATGHVVVREIRPGVTIDYEEFEVLYLTVRVRDLNTVIGDDYDESTFTITIIDMNDNPPVWGEGQLAQAFRVREMSDSGVVIGSVFATDIDGPLYNQVRYTITPRTDTPDNLVAINFVTGQITVKDNRSIDADEPPRHYLYYTIVASDECSLEDVELCPPDKTINTDEANIMIEIIDTNNKVPRIDRDKFENIVYIFEASPHGTEITQIDATDLDRDLPHSNVSYQINYAVNHRLRNFFEVDLVTGILRVHYTGDEILDRDGAEPDHHIFFNIIDNFLGEGDGNSNRIAEDVDILVVLLDINDNAPEMPSPSDLYWTMSENLQQGIRIQPHIFAFDRDEPGTPNSQVAYDILHLTTERDIEVPKLFEMITIETEHGIEQTGELETAIDLRGYWGTYEIHIEAFDHGVPQQKSDEKYQLVIRPYNYHNPEFVFPKDGSIIRLSRERAVVNGILVTAGAEGAPLPYITATDEDGLHAGTVTFSIEGDVNAVDYFDIWNDGENFGTLTLKRALAEGAQQFQLTIRATDGGDEPGPRSTDSTVTVVFVQQGEPVFSPNTQEVAFFESEAGMEERYLLRAATDPKNTLCDEDIDCYDIYYSIIDGNADGHFALDGAWIYLVKELDRSESESHTLLVAASNTPDVTSAQPASTLTVTITVREVNPRPRFERHLYTAGFASTDDIHRELQTVHATHSEGLVITYTIDQESMDVDPSLEAVADVAFNLDQDTGLLRLNIQPTSSMHGIFAFNVVATDTSGGSDRAAVKVYVISSRNRVYFRFDNTEQQVNQNREFIADTFSTAYEMTCNIDQTLPASDANGIAIESMTEVRAHFIQDDLPVLVEVIEELRNDVGLMWSIALTLETKDLLLTGVQIGDSPLPGGDQALAVYILAGIAGLFAVLCLILLITFIIRNRALNRRIAALSMTKYSSVDSGLNRIGLAAPGTNKHAVEGSNPIWNETIKAPDFDAISEMSNDSDLIGIEDLPQFRSDYFPPEFDESIRNNDVENPEVTSARNPIANHQNNFGFNTTPFSPDFANTQMRK